MLQAGDWRQLRLAEACFHPSYRREFVLKNDSLDRKGLDARNSLFRNGNFWELGANKFNDASWVPKSRKLLDAHSSLKDEVDLIFEGEEIRNNCGTIFKPWYKDVRAKVIVALSRWRTSGNGARNKGNVTIIGLFYEEDNHDKDVKFVDNDRATFAQRIDVLYF